MGRSVSYPTHATAVTFEHHDFEDEFDWLDLVDDYRYALKQTFPSVISDDEWLDREDHAVASNGHAYFGLSEYGGLVAFWMVPREDSHGYVSPLAEAWCASVAAKFEASFGSLRKVGSFSNGGGIYARRDGEPVGPDQFDTSPITINGLLTDG